uniref:Uncharacterized protein n=2 Tax=Rhizophagus irregularis TaxID=588596 RepID=U9UK19_RHIID
MELHKNLVEEEQCIKVFVQKFSKAIPKGKTAISKTSEQGTAMDNYESKWCGDFSQHGVRRPSYFLFNKLWSSSENLNDSRTTNKLSIQTFKPTGKLDSTPRGRRSSFSGSFYSFNNFFQIGTSETLPKSEESLIWGIIDWYPRNQSRVIADTTGVRQKEPAHFAMRREWKFIGEDGTMGLWQLHQSERVAENSNNINKKTRSKGTMPELSGDNETQYNKNLLSLRNLLKNKYPFHKETNKENLYDDEINMFVKIYNVIDARPILAYDEAIFWLKDLNDVIYVWFRNDEIMICAGCNLKEAMNNFIFRQEKLYYVEEDTHHLISVKEVEDKAINCYKEGKKTAIVVSEESLEPLKKVKEALKKGGEKRKKKKKNK